MRPGSPESKESWRAETGRWAVGQRSRRAGLESWSVSGDRILGNSWENGSPAVNHFRRVVIKGTAGSPRYKHITTEQERDSPRIGPDRILGHYGLKLMVFGRGFDSRRLHHPFPYKDPNNDVYCGQGRRLKGRCVTATRGSTGLLLVLFVGLGSSASHARPPSSLLVRAFPPRIV